MVRLSRATDMNSIQLQEVANRLYPTLRHLEDHLAAAARPWCQPAQVASLIHRWLADQANSGAPA